MAETGASAGNGGGATHRVLFVCLGNICRSPAAAAIFRAEVAKRGLDGVVEADSAGTSGYHRGEPPDPRMRAAAAERGYKLLGHARPVEDEDFDRFDLIVAMDRSNLRDLESQAPAHRHRLHLLSDFLSEDWPRDVPDPYYGGDEGFQQVLDMLERACPRVLDALLE